MGIKTNTNSVIDSDFLKSNSNTISTSKSFFNNLSEDRKSNSISELVDNFSLDDILYANKNITFNDGIEKIFKFQKDNENIQLLSINNQKEYVITNIEQLSELQDLYAKCYNTVLDLYQYEVGDAFSVIYRDNCAPLIKFDNPYLDNNLDTKLKNIVDNYSTGKEGFVDDFVMLFKTRLNGAESNRERAVATALFFACDFPKMDYNFGGCHDLKSENDFLPETIIDILVNNNEFDCSSLLSCCFKSGGINISDITNDSRTSLNSWDIEAMPSYTLDSGKGRAGDAVYFEGSKHVGIISSVNERKKEIAIVHSSSSGEGVSVLIVDSETGKVKTNYGTDSTGKLAPGKQYFTHIVPIDYGDKEDVSNSFNL